MRSTLISDLAGLRGAQDQRRRNFTIGQVSQPKDWGFRDGALQHTSGGFFSVSGFRDLRYGQQHLLLHQPQGAVNGWVSRWFDGRRDYLVQARAEPGNVGGVQFGPTLQSTPANYLRLHGGAASSFAELFLNYTPNLKAVFETQQLDQGGRYAQKTKRVGMIETTSETQLPMGFHWVTAEVLTEAAGLDFLLNTDFKAGLAVLPWSSDPASGELTPRSDLVRKSLASRVREEGYGAAVMSVQGELRPLDTVPLEELEDWRISANGIEPLNPDRNISVNFYKCTADAREVASWVQPLVAADGQGLVVLACRVREGLLEIRVSVSDEVGLPTGSALGPTYLSYPGEAARPPEWLQKEVDTPWLETHESDEGGRFYNHRSRYRLVFVPDELTIAEPGAWLNVAELKAALMTSNLCTIQLRTVAALLLAAA